MTRVKKVVFGRLRRFQTAIAVGGFAALVVIAVVVVTRDAPLPGPRVDVLDPGAPDPYAYSPDRRPEFEHRAEHGFAHALYAKSPGGVVATAERVDGWRPEVERAAATAGIDVATLEAIVFLESAGRPEVAADPKLEGAVGLTQILAETGRGLLGMRVDPRAARRLTKRIARAGARGDGAAVDLLLARRRRVDERFDPVKSLAATGRYLNFARARLGRDDFAVASYHMGVGNLQSVIADFERAGGSARSYAEVYFDSTPYRRAAAWRRLARLGDDSSTYLWRVGAAAEIMRAFRQDREALESADELYTAKNSAEEILHPPGTIETYADPDALEEAYREGELRFLPNAPGRLGLRLDPAMGELAPRLEAERRLYRGLRPQAYALAVYLADLTRRAGGGEAPLTVTSTVRDLRYQRALRRRNAEATGGYSLHTTGWALDILRRYSGPAQARAFQFALDRLQALDLIAWVREPAAIHLTVSPEAGRLEGSLQPAGGD